MSKIMIGTDEVLKVMFGLDEVSSLSMGEETIPITPPTPPAPDYSTMPFTIEALESGNITIKPSSSSLVRKFYYSINGGNQVLLEIGGSVSVIQIPVNDGDVVEFIAKENQDGTAQSTSGYIVIDGSAGTYFNVYGNILSLSYIDYESASSMTGTYCYANLFKGSSCLINAENLVVPNVTLTNGCLYGAFSGTTQLATAPQLKPTAVSQYCYQYMFDGSSIQNAPELLSDTTQRACYWAMFQNCTNLTTAPELPATALTQDCYRNMFAGCTSLTTAPELPATDIVRGGYFWMFNGCTNLNYIKCLATTNLSVYQGLTSWLNGVSATGTFVKDANATWPSGVNGIPEGWTVVDA